MTPGGLNEAEQIQRTSDHRDLELQASDIKHLRELEEENRRLKQISADLLLENRALKDVIAKKL